MQKSVCLSQVNYRIEQFDPTNFLESCENASIIHQYENRYSRSFTSPTESSKMTQFQTGTGQSCCDILHKSFT